MHTPTRRQYLAATVSAVALAGCGQDSDTTTPPPTPGTLVDETLTLEEYNFESFPVELSQLAQLSITATVESGPVVDVLFIREEDFEAFRTGGEFQTNKPLSETNTGGFEGTVTVNPGSYRLLINHNATATVRRDRDESDRTATVTVTLTIDAPQTTPASETAEEQ